jgi:hypothetical protein
VEVVVDTRGAPAGDEALARLRAQLESDRDFAARSTAIEQAGICWSSPCL